MPGSCYCGRREVGTIGNAANVVLAVVVAAGLAGPAAAPLHAVDRPAPADRPPVVALPEPLTREAIRGLVARLSDADVRQLLVAQLDHAAVTPPAAATAPGMAP